MIEPHKMWIKQCEAAQRIRDDYGINKPLGYLIGEKFLRFMRVVDNDPDFKLELPNFVEEIKHVFEQQEIRSYFENLRRVGALGHVYGKLIVNRLTRLSLDNREFESVSSGSARRTAGVGFGGESGRFRK